MELCCLLLFSTHVLLCLLEHLTPFCILGIPSRNTSFIKRQKRHQLLSNRNIIPADQSEVSVHKSFFRQTSTGWSWEKKCYTCFLFLWQQYPLYYRHCPFAVYDQIVFYLPSGHQSKGDVIHDKIHVKIQWILSPRKRSKSDTCVASTSHKKTLSHNKKNAMWIQGQLKNKQSKLIQQKKRYNLF